MYCGQSDEKWSEPQLIDAIIDILTMSLLPPKEQASLPTSRSHRSLEPSDWLSLVSIGLTLCSSLVSIVVSEASTKDIEAHLHMSKLQLSAWVRTRLVDLWALVVYYDRESWTSLSVGAPGDACDTMLYRILTANRYEAVNGRLDRCVLLEVQISRDEHDPAIQVEERTALHFGDLLGDAVSAVFLKLGRRNGGEGELADGEDFSERRRNVSGRNGSDLDGSESPVEESAEIMSCRVRYLIYSCVDGVCHQYPMKGLTFSA